MKKSKRAVEEVFKNKEFTEFISAYFDGDFDPYKPEHWILDSWELAYHRFDMTPIGAESMKALDEKDSYAINITQKNDDYFTALSVKRAKAGLLLWLLDIVGFEDYQEMKKFDPYDYDLFNEYITTYQE